MLSIEPFLLDPGNRAFLAGEPLRRRAVLRARLGLLFLAAVMAVCLFITAWAGMEWFRWLMLQGDHPIVSAEVVSCRKDTNTDGAPQYYVTYCFEAPTPTGPVVYQREQNVGKCTYARLHAGETVSVRYSSAFPWISSIADDTSFRDGISLGALMWVPVTLYMAWQVKRRRRAVRLGTLGQVVEGRVVRCTGEPDAEGGFRIELRYRFTAPGGRIIRARETSYRHDLRDEPLPDPDTPVAILYLDERNYKVL